MALCHEERDYAIGFSRHDPHAAPVRDARDSAPVVVMNLQRSTEELHADLSARYPLYIGMWWELETDEKSGWVYRSDGHLLDRLRARVVRLENVLRGPVKDRFEQLASLQRPLGGHDTNLWMMIESVLKEPL